MIEEAIKRIREFEAGTLSPQEARAFMQYAIDSGLVWTKPGVWGVAQALQYQRDGGIK